MPARFPVALVGVGKIARDQHIPAIAADPDFELVAAVSRNATIEGVPGFTDLDTFLADGPPAAVALCVPPEARTAMALKALAAGRDVLLEKPPAATLGEVDLMVAAAREAGAVLFATWHSRFAPAVGRRRRPGSRRAARAPSRSSGRRTCAAGTPSRPGLAARRLRRLRPRDQRPVAAHRDLPGPFVVDRARLVVPQNCETPVAADFAMTAAQGFPVSVELDWRQEGPQILLGTSPWRRQLRALARPLARRGGDGRRRPRDEPRAGPGSIRSSTAASPTCSPPARARWTRARSASSPTPSWSAAARRRSRSLTDG